MTEVIIMAAIMLPVYLVINLTPYLTRKTESFGVSIPESIYNTKLLKEMRKKYLIMMILLSILSTFLLLLSGFVFNLTENIIATIIIVGLTIYLIISFLIYLYFHRQMKSIKNKTAWSKSKPQRTVISTQFHSKKLTFSNFWFIISFLFILITAVITLYFYQQIPDKIPMNYNFSGEVTNSASKSYLTVFFMPIMQTFMTLLFMGINIIIAKAKQQVSAEDPETSVKRNVIFRRKWSAFLIISGVTLTAFFSVLQFTMIFALDEKIAMITGIIFTLGIVVGSIGMAINTGQGGSRIKLDSTNSDHTIDRDEDEFWKLGMFYFNKNDPTIFLEKRFGIGWTNNWAHPVSWILIIGILLIAVGLPLLFTL